MKVISWKWQSMPDLDMVTQATQAMEETIVRNQSILAGPNGEGAPQVFGAYVEFPDETFEIDAAEFNGKIGATGQSFAWPGGVCRAT